MESERGEAERAAPCLLAFLFLRNSPGQAPLSLVNMSYKHASQDLRGMKRVPMIALQIRELRPILGRHNMQVYTIKKCMDVARQAPCKGLRASEVESHCPNKNAKGATSVPSESSISIYRNNLSLSIVISK